MKKNSTSPEQVRYRKLLGELRTESWLLNGSVMKVAPRSGAGQARTTYVWTRKIKAKTVSVALSKEQYAAFREAIAANRELENTLKKLRQLSEKILLETLPGVKRKPRKNSPGK
ncbi:MAG TPA: DUF6788 family protein [Nitrospiria bacterium]|nr:DUF6788 family protein [Nitrospiria bacterium]